jgi:hypothetical protein
MTSFINTGGQLPLLWAVCQAAAEHGTPVVGVVISAQPKTFGASLFNPVALGCGNHVLHLDKILFCIFEDFVRLQVCFGLKPTYVRFIRVLLECPLSDF